MSGGDVSPAIPGHWKILLHALARLPQGALSRVTGRTADVRIPRPLRRRVLGTFARIAGINLTEAALPLDSYSTLDEFFVRQLRPGARSWPADPDTITSPVDGVVGQIGRIADGCLVQAKGRHYSAAHLLDDAVQAARFDAGAFITLYLSPRHYHRVHAPATGVISGGRCVPGALLPVNGPAIAMFDALFPRNERLICYLDGGEGTVAIVAVGAFNVGRITLAFDPGVATNRRNARPIELRFDPPKQVGRGEEIMAFHLGSTVVLLFERDRVRLDARLESGREIRLGEPIARPATE